MVSEALLRKQLDFVLHDTGFDLGERFEGKVRDNYRLNGKRIIVTTDRISAFDRVLCRPSLQGPGHQPDRGLLVRTDAAYH